MTKAVPVKKKRIRNPEKTREMLLQATVDLISEKGVEALSMKEAATRAGLSRSLAYLHFEDRDHLLREAKKWIKDKLQHGVVGISDDTTLYDRILFTTKLVLDYPELSRIMIMDALSGGDLKLTDPLTKAIKKRIKTAIKDGALEADIDPDISTHIHLGSIASTLFYLDQNPKLSKDKLAERFAKQWSKYLHDGVYRNIEL